VLSPAAELALPRRHTFDRASIRTRYPGPQTVAVQVNGRVLGACRIDAEVAVVGR
jgi:hypothetical protein